MKKIIYSLILIILASSAQGQVNKLTQGEYFWDNDPGEGSATVLSAADGNFDSTLENILQNSSFVPSTAGFHTLNIRVKDNLGIWGPVFKNVIFTGTPANLSGTSLTKAEYFWDNDPGEGNGNALNAIDGGFDGVIENILQNQVPIAQPIGLHTLNVRVKDSQGFWGPVFKNIIYIESTLLSTNDADKKQDFSVYPNPAADILKFTADGKVMVYDMSGRLVSAKENVRGNSGIDVSVLAQGAYTLIIKSMGKTYVSKFIKK